MLWKKPNDLKYTDLCIYIDENCEMKESKRILSENDIIDVKIAIAKKPAIMFTAAPAIVMINLCQAGFLLKALGSSLSPSSPTMAT